MIWIMLQKLFTHNIYDLDYNREVYDPLSYDLDNILEVTLLLTLFMV